MKVWTLLAALGTAAAACSNAPAETRSAHPDATVAAAAPAAPVPPPAPTEATAMPGVTPGKLPTPEKMRLATDAAAKALIDGDWTPGLVVALVDESGDTFLTYGVAREGGAPVDADTIFEIGSITKVFTSLALEQLADAGKVHLDQPVAELLPKGTKVPEKNGKKITLEQLATHHSGLLRVPTELDELKDPYAAYDAKKLFEYLAHATLQTTPGEAYEYSNTGGGLLGFALALRARVPYAKLVVEGIARPLGMKSTFVDVPKAAEAHLAQGTLDGQPVPAWHFDALAGAGALHSSARDLARFVRAQLGLLPAAEVPAPLRKAIEATHTPRADTEKGQRIALGWMVTADGTRWWHNGATAGFSSFVAFDPVRKRGIVVLANVGDPRMNNVALHLAQAWNAAPSDPMKLPITAKLDPAKLDDYVGQYPITAQFIMKVVRVGNHLRLQVPGQPELGLWPTTAEKFYLRTIDAKVEFFRDASGTVIGMTLEQNGKKQRAPRGAPGQPLPTPPENVPESPHGGIANPGVIK